MKEYEKITIEEMKKAAESPDAALKRLMAIVTLLRHECPWDKVQTHDTLKTCMIEEAYEVCDAIDRKDFVNLKEELGDVVLQVVFHSIMAEEENKFDITGVINAECEKMIRRHPHIFSKEKIKSIDNVLEKWENIKRSEHSDRTYFQELESVPKGMPALMRSYKVQKKAANAGFDWDDAAGAVEKLEEETAEVAEAWKNGNKDEIRKELGDVLFSVVNTARLLKIDPEQALHESTEKFIRRFGSMERIASENGKELSDMTLPEMDMIWEEVKKDE